MAARADTLPVKQPCWGCGEPVIDRCMACGVPCCDGCGHVSLKLCAVLGITLLNLRPTDLLPTVCYRCYDPADEEAEPE